MMNRALHPAKGKAFPGPSELVASVPTTLLDRANTLDGNFGAAEVAAPFVMFLQGLSLNAVTRQDRTGGILQKPEAKPLAKVAGCDFRPTADRPEARMTDSVDGGFHAAPCRSRPSCPGPTWFLHRRWASRFDRWPGRCCEDVDARPGGRSGHGTARRSP